MKSPKENISFGETPPSPPVSLTPQEEEEDRKFWEGFDAAMARVREKAKEAERRGIPLHEIVPVN